jgi:hypothetical protein
MWLGTDTSAALLRDFGVPQNARNLLASCAALSLLHGVTQDEVLWRAFVNTVMNIRAQ